MTEPHQEVTQFIESAASPQREIMEALRRLVHRTVPEVVEDFKWGQPVYLLNGLLCYIRPAKEDVTLGFFQGHAVRDTEEILQGSGKKMRHLKVKSVDELRQGQIERLIDEAARVNREN